MYYVDVVTKQTMNAQCEHCHGLCHEIALSLNAVVIMDIVISGSTFFFDYLWFGLKKLIVWGITYNIYELKVRNLPSFFIKNDFKKPNFFYDVKQPSTSLIMIFILKGLIG